MAVDYEQRKKIRERWQLERKGGRFYDSRKINIAKEVSHLIKDSQF